MVRGHEGLGQRHLQVVTIMHDLQQALRCVCTVHWEREDCQSHATRGDETNPKYQKWQGQIVPQKKDKPIWLIFMAVPGLCC